MRFTTVTLSPSCLEKVDAFKYPCQLGNINLQGRLARFGLEPFKRAFLQPLVPDDKSGSIPEQYLALVAVLVEEHEQVAAERISQHETLRQHRQFIESAPHISRLSVNIYLDRGRQSQHRPASRKTERTLLKALLSAASPIRKVLPEVRTSSKPPSASILAADRNLYKRFRLTYFFFADLRLLSQPLSPRNKMTPPSSLPAYRIDGYGKPANLVNVSNTICQN